MQDIHCANTDYIAEIQFKRPKFVTPCLVGKYSILSLDCSIIGEEFIKICSNQMHRTLATQDDGRYSNCIAPPDNRNIVLKCFYSSRDKFRKNPPLFNEYSSMTSTWFCRNGKHYQRSSCQRGTMTKADMIRFRCIRSIAAPTIHVHGRV